MVDINSYDLHSKSQSKEMSKSKSVKIQKLTQGQNMNICLLEHSLAVSYYTQTPP